MTLVEISLCKSFDTNTQEVTARLHMQSSEYKKERVVLAFLWEKKIFYLVDVCFFFSFLDDETLIINRFYRVQQVEIKVKRWNKTCVIYIQIR